MATGPQELGHLRQLTAQLRECADQATAIWRELGKVLHLPADDQLGRIREIDGANQSNTESWYLMGRVEYLKAWVRKIEDS